MYSSQFDKLVMKFRELQDSVIHTKKTEYLNNNDRLTNFRTVGELEGRRMSQVAITLLLNHIQRITNAVNSGNYKWSMWDGEKEGLQQRIVDAMNYLYLLAACLEEEEQTRVIYEAKLDATQADLKGVSFNAEPSGGHTTSGD